MKTNYDKAIEIAEKEIREKCFVHDDEAELIAQTTIQAFLSAVNVEDVAEVLYRHDRKGYGNWRWELKYQPHLIAEYFDKAKAALDAIKGGR